MTERWAISLAAAAALGSLLALPVPVVVMVAAVAVTVLTARPAALVLAVGLGCSALAGRALDGLEPPEREQVHGWAVLVSDPRRVGGGAVRVDVRLEGRRLQAWARGRDGTALLARLAGEEVHLRGVVARLAPSAAHRLRWRHIAGRLTVEEVGEHRPGPPHARIANGLRRTLAAGAVDLGVHDRSLLAGFVLGDDRDQPADLADDFRASGLSHLLAVSGQNVAFTLMLFAPVLRRLPRVGRLVATGLVLLLFGTITRWEPSVIRAVAMAGVAIGAADVGRPSRSLRTLALAVTGLLLIDPMLVHSVGFVLSAGACLGIASLSGPLGRLVPGPGWLRSPVAVTLAAQAGVSPILVPVFGGVAVASLPANLLAAPAAGPAMVWGLGAGVAAGLVGPPVDGWLHGPTSLLLGYVRWVASTTAALPLGEVGPRHLAALAVVSVVAALLPASRRLAVVVALVVLLLPAVALRTPRAVDGEELANGARLWRQSGATVVAIEGDPHDTTLLAALRRSGVTRIDVLVVGGRSAMGVLDALRASHDIRHLAAPAGGGVSGAARFNPGDVLVAGDLHVRVAAVEPRLRLERVTAPDGTGPTPG